MPFIKKLNKDFIACDDHFELSLEYLNKNKFKKITGTRLFPIVNESKYNSPFKIWCQIVGIYQEIMDPILAKAGEYIEQKIRDYVSKKMNLKFKSYIPLENKWDIFKENEIFGGIPDGEPIDDNGNLDYTNNHPMLEIKTTSIDSFVYKKIKGVLQLQIDDNGVPIVKQEGAKKSTWFDKNGKLQICEEYMYQLGLYLYLRKVNAGLFAICFLNKEDYAKPIEFDVNKHEIYLTRFSFRKGYESFQPIIDKAKNWYEKYVKSGKSPIMTENDKLWLKEVEFYK